MVGEEEAGAGGGQRPVPPKKLRHGKRRVHHRRNLSTSERMAEAERERENRRLARSLAHAGPAIDNHNERSREFEIKKERELLRYNSGDRPVESPSPRGALDSVQARETAALPDIRPSLELPAAGPPSSVVKPEDDRKEAERDEIHQQQAEAARVEAERVAAEKLERAKKRAEHRAAKKAMAKERELRERELSKRRVIERSEERRQVEEERAARRKEAEEERFYQAQALKATLQSKTEVRGQRLAEDRAAVMHRKAHNQEERARAFKAQKEAEDVRRMAAQTDRASRRARFEGAKTDQDLTPSGPSSTVVSRAAARAVAKAVRDAELRAHEEMVAAHRKRLKDSGAPVIRGGRLSSTPRPGKGVDWSRSQSERGHARDTVPRADDVVVAQTARTEGGARWEQDEVALARLTALAATLGGDAPADGVHDALAVELQKHGPMPPGVLSGLLAKGGAEDGRARAKKTGTWPTSKPRGHHARSGEPPPVIAALMERAAAGSLTEEELTDLELNSSERLPSGWLRQIRMTIRQQRFTTGGARNGGRSSARGDGSGASSSGNNGRPARLTVPRLRGPIVPKQEQASSPEEEESPEAATLTDYDVNRNSRQIVRATFHAARGGLHYVSG